MYHTDTFACPHNRKQNGRSDVGVALPESSSDLVLLVHLFFKKHRVTAFILGNNGWTATHDILFAKINLHLSLFLLSQVHLHYRSFSPFSWNRIFKLLN